MSFLATIKIIKFYSSAFTYHINSFNFYQNSIYTKFLSQLLNYRFYPTKQDLMIKLLLSYFNIKNTDLLKIYKQHTYDSDLEKFPIRTPFLNL